MRVWSDPLKVVDLGEFGAFCPLESEDKMSRKRYTPEQIRQQREAEVASAQSQSVVKLAHARRIGAELLSLAQGIWRPSY